MKLEELLEKRERSILRLLHRLKDCPHQTKIKELSDYLELSRATLLRYVEGFNHDAQEAGLQLRIEVADEHLIYHRAIDLSATTLLHFLLESSIKYQILSYIFERDEFSLQELAQELLISEASLSRQLSSLNKLLAEFGLSIRNGRLKGSELQVRYFYFHLFWYSGGSYLTDFSQYKAGQKKFLELLTKLYGEEFRPKQAEQLSLWLTICQRRMRLGHLDFKDCRQKMTPYLNHKFYSRLRQLCFTMFDQWAGSFQEGEVMCLFIFLFTMFILPAAKVEQMMAFGGPIKEAATLGLTYLRQQHDQHFDLNEEALYQLNQLFGQAYFIKGRLFVADTDFDLFEFSEAFRQEGHDLYERICTQVYHQILCEEDELGNYISHEMTKLVYYLSMESPRQLLIGLDLSKDKITMALTLDWLRKELEQNRSIRIEEWQEETYYDLIISDYRQFSDTRNYQLHRGLTKQDIKILKDLLKAL